MGTPMTNSLPDAIDSAALQRWARACAQTLARQKEEINRLNVFPVPDLCQTEDRWGNVPCSAC